MKEKTIVLLRKSLIIFILISLILCVCLIILSRTVFRSIPENSVVQQILIDDLDQIFIVTQDNKLYIGGQNGDRFGFYNTGLHWGTLYGLRNLFREQKPVLFSERVSNVFQSVGGVLYSDPDGFLYYFGEQNGGKKEVIADNVRVASQSDYGIAYITNDFIAYYIARDYANDAWTSPKMLANKVQDICIAGECIWLRKESGDVFTVELTFSEYIYANEDQLVARNIRKMWCGRKIAILETTDGSYQVIKCSDGKNISIHSLAGQLGKDDYSDIEIIDAELKGPYPGDYILIDRGNIIKIGDDNITFFMSVYEQNVSEFEIGSNFLYVINHDGSYQRIAFKE